MSDRLGPQQLIRLKEQFQLLDSNGDGAISSRELAQVCSSLGMQVPPQMISEMMREADHNFNGLLQFDDWLALVNRVAPNDGSIWGSLLAASEAATSTSNLPLTPDQTQRLRKLFDELDLDRNGHLSVSEIHLLFSKSLKLEVSLQEVQQMVAMADSSGNGQVEFNEFLQLVCRLQGANSGLWGKLLKGISPQNRPLTEAQVQQLRIHFDQLDLDGNGHVTTSELYLMFKAMKVPISQAALQQLITDADQNANGEIEFDEFIALCCNLKATDQSAWVQLLKATNPGRLDRMKNGAEDFFGLKTEAQKKDVNLYRQKSAFQRRDQPQREDYWTQTIRQVRGVGKVKEKQKDIEMGKDTIRNDPEVRKQVREQAQRSYRPYFLLLVTLAQLGVMAAELIINGGFEKPIDNVLFGPSKLTMLKMGAKYAPCMRANEAQRAATPYLPCGSQFPEDQGMQINGTCMVEYYAYYSYFCGMGGFTVPNQWWRFFIPIFLHSGLIEIAFTVVFQVWKGFPIERDIGPLRMGIIYLLSGFFGVAWSANMSSDLISAGGTGPLFALLGLLYLDLFQNWQLIVAPWRWFTILTVIIVLMLGIGLLPFIDNYSHLGGFLMGILTGLIFVPYISFGKWDGRRKKIALFSAVPIVILCFVAAYWSFYDGKDTNYCKYCSAIDCVPVGSPWCSSGLSF